MMRRLRQFLLQQRDNHSLAHWISLQTAWVVATLLLSAFTWNRLGLLELPTTKLQWITRITLTLASVWTGTVIALALLLVAAPFRRPGRGFRLLEAMLLFLVGFVHAFNIPYIDFFAAHPAPPHLRYLFDFEFLRGSSDAALNPSFLLLAVAPPTVWLILSVTLPNFVRRMSKKAELSAALFLIFAAALCQVAKVNLNTKKFGFDLAPQILRVTSVEHLLTESGKLFLAQQFSSHETMLLRQSENHLRDKESLADLLQGSLRMANMPIGLELKKIVKERLDSARPVVFFVALLESFRPHESRFYHPELAEGEMPHFDTLVENGIVFRNAWSTSNVTRAAQEAVACGLQTGPTNSVMRDKIQNRPQCLPDHFSRQFGSRSFSAFWHAGRYSFDSQGFFWTRHSMNRVLSHDDFADNSPRTFWGKSDFALVDRVAEELGRARADGFGPEFHLFLSVTNHHNFSLPSDAPGALKQRVANRAIPDNVATHRYTDEALGRLERAMRDAGRNGESIWSQTILVVLGDHGTLMPTSSRPSAFRFGGGEPSDLDAAEASSHLALAVSGGLTAEALKRLGIKNYVDNIPRSQSDVAATIADLAGVTGFATVGDSLFANRRRWPVVVDLLDTVFFPELNLVLSKSDTEREISTIKQISDFGKLYLRATRALLDAGEAGRTFEAKPRD